MQQITAQEFAILKSRSTEIELVDVREPFEHELYNIGGKLIPLGELIMRANELAIDRPIVFYCEKGIRSQIAIQRLESLGFTQLFNLVGGMAGWRKYLATIEE